MGADDPANDPRSDQQLVADANGGDESAFASLYQRYRDWVVSLAMRFLGGDADLALDVLQEAYLYLLSKFPGMVLTSRLTTFLYPAVKNLSIQARKKARRFAGADEEILGALPAAPGLGGDTELAHVMSGLPETHREVVLMRFVDGLSMEEIAQALGIPTGTVKSRLHNAIAMLRDDPRVKKFFEV